MTERGLSRRRFIGAAGAAAVGAATGWVPGIRVLPAAASGTHRLPPPGFPKGIRLYKQSFENWSGETSVDAVWTCAPASDNEIVAIANWARGAGYTVRPRGFMHNWAPFTITNDQSCASPVVLLDTTSCLVAMSMVSGDPASVRVQTGATMEALLGFLEDNGKSLASVPAVGQITVGGALAIDGHGAVTPAVGETPAIGHAFASLSNLILSLTAVVWNAGSNRYELRTFTRTDPETKALLTHLGRAFLTEVVLQVGPAQNLRCRSYTNITAATLFAPPASAGRHSYAAFLDASGRAEVILYPFTAKPWLKVWSVSPTKPLTSRPTTVPYNYPFSDNLPKVLTDLIDDIISGNGAATPLLGRTEYAVTVAGLRASLANDLWGTAKNTQLYIKATTLRLAEGGGVILCARSDVQRVVSEFYAKYQSLVTAYQALDRFPMNGPIEIRATSVDRASDVLVAGAEAPALSALLARADRPEWDTAVWTNMLTFPGTPYSYDFYAEMESWARENYASYGCVRAEWSKGWGFSTSGPWTDPTALSTAIPDSYRVARGAHEDWDWALGALNDLDPHRIFSNPLLDTLLP